MKRFVKRGCLLLMLVGVLAVMTGCGTEKIDLNDYLTYEITGMDGYAKVHEKFDEGRFENDLIAATGMRGGWDDADILYRVEDAVEDGSWDKKTGLKNGDEITYTWTVNPEMLKKQYKVVFKCKPVKVKVDGLEKPGEFDPFEMITINVSGQSPSGKLKIEANKDVDGSFEADKTEGLKNGDEIKITYSYGGRTGDEMKELCANDFGKIPTRTEMTYTVEGLDSYADSLSQIPEETVNAMVEEAETDFRAYVAQRWNDTETLQNMEYLGCYVMLTKDPSERWWDDAYAYERVYIVHKITATNEESAGSFDYFYFTAFDNVIVKADGTVEVDLNNTSTPDGGVGFLGIYGAAFQTADHAYVGYATYDDLYNDIVTAQADSYSVEDNVKKPENAVYYEDVQKPEE